MRVLKLIAFALTVAAMAFADDVPVAVPEIGADGTTIASAIGIVAGGLLVLRARRK